MEKVTREEMESFCKRLIENKQDHLIFLGKSDENGTGICSTFGIGGDIASMIAGALEENPKLADLLMTSILLVKFEEFKKLVEMEAIKRKSKYGES